MKNLRTKERNRRKYRKMYKSIENKLSVDNLIWWNSLSMRARYSVVFKWRDYKKFYKGNKFKHFLSLYKNSYRVEISSKRNAIIDHFLS